MRAMVAVPRRTGHTPPITRRQAGHLGGQSDTRAIPSGLGAPAAPPCSGAAEAPLLPRGDRVEAGVRGARHLRRRLEVEGIDEVLIGGHGLVEILQLHQAGSEMGLRRPRTVRVVS